MTGITSDFNWAKLFTDHLISGQELEDDSNQERKSTGRFFYYTLRDKNEQTVLTLGTQLKIRAYGEFKYFEDLPNFAKISLLKYMKSRYESHMKHESKQTTKREDNALQKLKEAGVI